MVYLLLHWHEKLHDNKMNIEYKYDVAFSFLQEDLTLVKKIRSYLNKSVKVFLYAENQTALVGKDGINIFHDVFEKESRVVVVFYRKSWGNTNWTRVEERALKNRFLIEGQGFLIFIPLDTFENIPLWIDRSRIWFDLDTFGNKSAAAIIEQRIKERGKELTKETIEEKSARLNELFKKKNEILNLLNDQNGKAVEIANQEFNNLLEYSKLRYEGLKKEISQFPFTHESVQSGIKLSSYGYNLYIQWFPRFRNTLSEAKLSIFINARKPSRNYYDDPGFYKLKSEEYFFNIDLDWQNCWTSKNDNYFYTNENIVEKWIDSFLDLLEKDIIAIKTYNSR